MKKKISDEKGKSSAGKTEIVVERVYGNHDLFELYSEYVANKIKEKKQFCVTQKMSKST